MTPNHYEESPFPKDDSYEFNFNSSNPMNNSLNTVKNNSQTYQAPKSNRFIKNFYAIYTIIIAIFTIFTLLCYFGVRQFHEDWSAFKKSLPPANILALFAKALAGDSQAQADLGTIYLLGKDVPQDLGEAKRWYEKSAAQNNCDGINGMGQLYQNGSGVPVDLAAAVSWYHRSSDMENPAGQRLLGLCYINGWGVPIDLPQGVSLLKRSAIAEDMDANIQLGLLYLSGKGVQKDPKRGFTYILLAADNGVGYAHYQIAKCYWEGVFVKKDPQRALEWAQLAFDSYQDKPELDLKKDILAAVTPEQSLVAAAWVKKRKATSYFIQEIPLPIHFPQEDSATIPFEMVSGDVRIHVQVAGKPCQFIVDTGADVTMLDEHFNGLSGTASPDYSSATGTGKNATLLQITHDVSLNIGDINLPHTSFALLSMDYLRNAINGPVDGILGADVLQNFVVTIDPINRTMTFTNPLHFHSDPAFTAIPLISEHNKTRFFVNTTLFYNQKSVDLNLRIDSGASNTFVINLKKIQDIGPIESIPLPTASTGLGGGLSKEGQVQLDKINIGNIIFNHPVIDTVPGDHGVWATTTGIQGLLGMETLQRFDLTLDFFHNILYLKKNIHFDDPYFLGPKYILSPNSTTIKEGFQAGDFLITFDGMDLKIKKPSEVKSLLQLPGAHKVTVYRNGKEVQLTYDPFNPPK